MSLKEILDSVSNSKRYRGIAADVITRIAMEEIPKARNQADATKRTKRHLHQIFGAYATPLPSKRLLEEMASARAEQDQERFLSLCRAAMSRHSSTQERLPFLETFYKKIFEFVDTPKVILDVACGLNPLAVPWMTLSPGCVYIGYDIDLPLLSFVDAFLELIEVRHAIHVLDAVVSAPAQAGDVALLLKAVPCLERQKTGAGFQALLAINSPVIVVSYPTRSLCGIEKGMRNTYELQFMQISGGQGWEVDKINFPNELVFIVRKKGTEKRPTP